MIIPVSAVFIGQEDSMFRPRPQSQPWHLTFEIQSTGYNGRHIHVRNAYGEQWKYYSSMFAFLKDWRPVEG